jgi:predicted nucleic acid-binding Zn ribbon protein
MPIDPDQTDDPWREPAAAEPVPARDAVNSLIASRGWETRVEAARVHTEWATIAGEQLARHTEPVRLHGGVLVVRASSSAWATQVRYLSRELVARANAVLGEGQVRQVTLIAGRLTGDVRD